MGVNITNDDWETFDWDNGTSLTAQNGSGVAFGQQVHAIDRIQFWVTPILVSFGCMGNVVSVWVFHSSKLRTLSSSCYLAALAASDTGFLLTLFLVWLSMVDYDLLNQHGWCQAINYAIYVTTFLSVWLVVAFTVERFIAVCYPLLRAAVCTVRRARMVILLLTIIALLLYSYLLVAAAPGMHPEAGRTICKLRDEYVEVATAMNYVDTVLTLILPVITIVTLNVRIARCVWHVEKLRHSMTLAHSHSSPPAVANNSSDSGRRGAGGNSSGPVTSTATQDSANSSVVVVAGNRGGQRIRSQNKVTKMLLIISTVFILLNLPSYVIRGYIFFWCDNSCETSSLFYTLQQTFTLLFYTNFAINFLLYCVTGQNFRRAVGGLCVGAARRHSANRLPFPSPASVRFPHSTIERNNSGAVMINIQLWEGPTRMSTHMTAQSPGKGYKHQKSSSRPHACAMTSAAPLSNGHTAISTLQDEKEDSF
ncbi:thyrotropin-releasing hormone receptor-like [Macrobrachium rosenbergii]|uniref:thyrotropin-releasing hormone receptor-like n=1 Tax=Macrobrachium rosenbergii TaxID=79674 RepID=UPI0034D4009E